MLLSSSLEMLETKGSAKAINSNEQNLEESRRVEDENSERFTGHHQGNIPRCS